MRITIAKNNRGFTRAEWLVVICLSVVAFEFGARYAEKHYASSAPPARKTAAANVPISSTMIMPEEEEPIPSLLETNFPPFTNPTQVRLRPAPPTNYVRLPPASPPGQIRILKGDGTITVRKVVGERPLVYPPNESSPGIRISVP